MKDDNKKIIEEIQKEDPVKHSPFQYGEWYDGWRDAIKYVVSVLERNETDQQ